MPAKLLILCFRKLLPNFSFQLTFHSPTKLSLLCDLSKRCRFLWGNTLICAERDLADSANCLLVDKQGKDTDLAEHCIRLKLVKE